MLDAVVGHDHHLALEQQSGEQVHQQFARQRAAIPTGFTQHLVVAAEPRPMRQAHHSQRSTDSALPGPRTARATSTNTRGQTAAVKPSRNGANQAASSGDVAPTGPEQTGVGGDPVSSAENARVAATAIHTAVHPPSHRASTIRDRVMAA